MFLGEFLAGDRVLTPEGPATVLYRRMSALDFGRVAAYSVRLDSKADQPGYTGSAYAAAQIGPLKETKRYTLDGEPLQGSLEDFIAANDFDAGLVHLLRALAPGQSATGDEGAGGRWTLACEAAS